MGCLFIDSASDSLAQIFLLISKTRALYSSPSFLAGCFKEDF